MSSGLSLRWFEEEKPQELYVKTWGVDDILQGRDVLVKICYWFAFWEIEEPHRWSPGHETQSHGFRFFRFFS